MGRGGRVANTRWWWWRGRALDNTRWGAGLGPNIQNHVVMACVWGAFGLQVDIRGPVGLFPSPPW